MLISWPASMGTMDVNLTAQTPETTRCWTTVLLCSVSCVSSGICNATWSLALMVYLITITDNMIRYMYHRYIHIHYIMTVNVYICHTLFRRGIILKPVAYLPNIDEKSMLFVRDAESSERGLAINTQFVAYNDGGGGGLLYISVHCLWYYPGYYRYSHPYSKRSKVSVWLKASGLVIVDLYPLIPFKGVSCSSCNGAVFNFVTACQYENVQSSITKRVAFQMDFCLILYYFATLCNKVKSRLPWFNYYIGT